MLAGLTDVPTASLRTALRHLHRGELDTPVTIVSLTRIGLQEQAGAMLAVFRDLDAAGVRAVLTTVIAERVAREQGRPAR